MQSVIVYRNPAEAALWEFLMSGEIFPFMLGSIVFVVIFVALNVITSKYQYRRGRTRTIRQWAIWSVSTISAVATVWYFLSKI